MLRVPLEPPRDPSPKRGVIPSVAGFLLLAIGSLFMQIGRTLTEVGLYWGGRRIRDDLSRSVARFSDTTPEQAARPASSGWQGTLVRFGPPIIISIVSIWALMWLVMLLGAPLAWLALNGYGAWLLLGCVLVGTAIGIWLAYLQGKSSRRSNLN